MDKVKKIFTAEVFDIESKDTLSGKFLAKFRARTTEGKMYLCTIWERDALKFVDKIKEKDKVYFEGYERDGEVNIKYFKSETTVTDNGGRKLAVVSQADVLAYREAKRAQGYEFIEIVVNGEKKTVSRSRKHCIKVNGKWEGRMDYVIKVLGAEYVSNALSSCGITEGGIFQLINKSATAPFNKLLTDLISFAASEAGHDVEWPDGEGKIKLPTEDSKPNQLADLPFEENDGVRN